MNHKEIFASNLRVKKEELKLTQGQLAIKMGDGKLVKRIGKYLEGKAAPRLEDIPELIRVFEIEDFYAFITKELKNTA